jgi:hypothetical protein
MVRNRNRWEESSDLFQAREDDNSPRHDVGGSINELLTEHTAHEAPLDVAALDGDELEDDELTQNMTLAAEVGLDVIGSCGHKIGEVVDVRPGHLVVEKGFFVPEDVYVPKTAIAKADEHHLTLSVSREASEHSGWERDPEGIEDEDVIEDADKRL